MALTKRRTSIQNPAKRRKAKKRNGAKRKMSAKQIKHFGTKAQKAALKRRRPGAKKKTRRNKPGSGRVISGYGSTVMNPRRKKRKNHSHKIVINRARTHRPRTKKRVARRRNFGEIIHYTLGTALGNPAGKGKMAKTKRRNTSRPAHRRVGRRNTARRRNGARRSNPFGGNWGTEIMSAMYVIAGAVGSKIGAQTILGASNTGAMGYAANLAVGGVGAWIIGGPMKNKKAAAAFFSGSVVEVLLRAINDYTPLGQYTASLGVGDAGVAGLGVYMPSNWVTPQRYLDPANSAMVQIPAGWAPTTVIQSAAPPAGQGMGDLYGTSGSGSPLY